MTQEMTQRNGKIDNIKAICIIAVILLHTLPIEVLEATFSRFHIWNAVTVFIILMAFTTYISCSKKELSIKKLYSLEYIKRRFLRVISPIVIIIVVELIYAKCLKQEIYIGPKNLIGYLPITGPGNYYISILIQYIILVPLLYYFYKKNRAISILGSFILNFVGEVLINYIVQDNYIYSACIVRYLFLIYLGFYLYDTIIQNNFETSSRKIKFFLIVGFILSLLYLIIEKYWKIPIFNQRWSKQLFLGNFYPIGLVYLMMRYLPEKTGKLDKIGKASYHIFLIQILYFIYNPIEKNLKLDTMSGTTRNILLAVLNIGICILIGLLFYMIEEKWRKIIDEHISSYSSKRWFKRDTKKEC